MSEELKYQIEKELQKEGFSEEALHQCLRSNKEQNIRHTIIFINERAFSQTRQLIDDLCDLKVDEARRDEQERIKNKLLILFFGVEEWDCNSIRVNRKEIYEQDWIDFWKELKP